MLIKIWRGKARLVACENEQLFGIDYNLTFAALIGLGTVKAILIISRRRNVPARHGNIGKHMSGKKEKKTLTYT